MATIHRAYGTAGDFKKYRFFTIYVTVLMLTLVLVHVVPALFPWVVTLYLTWSPWHYTGQNFGIAQMFVRRSGAHPDPAARQWLYTSYVASFAVWFLTLHSIVESDSYFLSLRIPETVATPLRLFFALVFLVSAAAAFLRLRKTLRGSALLAPLLLTLTQALWFVAPSLLSRYQVLDLPASYFSAGALAFMHCAQYLWITSFYARRETPSAPHAATSARPFSFWRYYLALIVGGIALFIPGPWLASRALGHDFVESFLIFMALVNVHHFILDGAIWKLRDGRIARLLLGKSTPDATDEALEGQSLRHHLGWLFSASPAARATRFSLAAAILAINPRNAPAQHLLGQLIFQSGDTSAALAHYDRMADFSAPISPSPPTADSSNSPRATLPPPPSASTPSSSLSSTKTPALPQSATPVSPATSPPSSNSPPSPKLAPTSPPPSPAASAPPTSPPRIGISLTAPSPSTASPTSRKKPTAPSKPSAPAPPPARPPTSFLRRA
ncbi:hypothetical protein CMV30_00845 [Nibricoccus aquaticus]|uniref:Uncharacterized protein n=1 Tax=Nibricoccus aquaticus TaxID=2576891 RepID=A0A290QFI6_9BACT|nr:hypothetical protein [Nibricoccus aquaticus]ATC62632.1 hypothetical protein CMV30_00845 [Nibricoccus aquaticus]